MNREQFISHVESTQEAFRRFLVALCCGDASLADDIAQETYLKAYLSCESITRSDKFKSWIFRIGYNTFVDHRRLSRSLVDIEQATQISSSDSADSRFKYQDLYLALGQLSPRERTALLLFYMEGYSIKEIAAILGASQSAVKQYLSRGRSHLRTLLSQS